MWPKSFGEIIQAVGALTGLVFAFAVVGGLVYFGRPLKQLLQKAWNLKFKKGDAELSMEAPPEVSTSSVVGSPAERRKEPDALPEPEERTQAESSSDFTKMIESISSGQLEDAKTALGRLQKAEDDAIGRLRNDVFYHFLMHRYGRDAQAIQRLEELAQKEDVRGDALFWLASCHEVSGDFTKAIGVYTRALSGHLTSTDRARHTVGLAKCHVALADTGEGLKVLTTALRDAPDPDTRRSLYRAIADVHEKTGNSTIRAVALQKVLEFSKEDPEALFVAAYSQADAKMACLCVANYRTLLRFRPAHGAGLNNLGVQSEVLELPMKSVSYYKMAVAQGETLAMANLANRYMNQGFESEAQDLLDKARRADKPHENVGTAMSSLAEKQKQEAEAWAEVTKAGVTQQEFFWAYADAYFVPRDAGSAFAGEWVSTAGKVFVVTQDGSTVSGGWEVEKYGERFVGTAENLAVEVRYQAKAETAWGTVAWKDSVEGFAYMSQDGSAFRLHTFNKREVFYLTLKRKNEESRKAMA